MKKELRNLTVDELAALLLLHHPTQMTEIISSPFVFQESLSYNNEMVIKLT